MRYLSLIRRRDELTRFRYVMGVLFRYGFGYLLCELKLGEHLPLVNRFVKKREEVKPLSVGERLRLVFEELGPTFIKFGQLLSNRVDVIPPEIIRELTKLQDHAPAFPSDTAQRIIGEELGRSPQELFGEFTAQPIAAASSAMCLRAGHFTPLTSSRSSADRSPENSILCLRRGTLSVSGTTSPMPPISASPRSTGRSRRAGWS